MTRITSKQIAEVLPHLIYAATYQPSGVVGVAVMAGTPFKKRSGEPTVKELFEAFSGLPDGHPLKKQFNPDTVKTGYDRLSSLGCNPNDPVRLLTPTLYRDDI